MVTLPLKFAAAFLAFLSATNVAAKHSAVGQPWTAQDIIAVPEVTDIRLSKDRQSALFVVRLSDLAIDQMRAELRHIKLDGGGQTVLFQAKTIKQFAHIPGTPDFSALVDFGEGVQLYRIQSNGNFRPLVINREPVLVGPADHAVPSYTNEPPYRVGILYHEWSPDGQWLWYSKLRQINASAEVSFDEAVTRKRDQRRSSVDALIEFWIRDTNGGDRLVTTRPSTDAVAYHFGGRVTWGSEQLSFEISEVDPQGRYSGRTIFQQLKDANGISNASTTMGRAIGAGIFSSEGIGTKRTLVETRESGQRVEYGEKNFVVGDPRSAGAWLKADRTFAILGTRNLILPRYGLALIENGKVSEIGTAASITKCDFDDDLALGVCLRQGLSLPPELAIVKPRAKTVHMLSSISPAHDRLTKFKVSARTWTNRHGYKATGFIMWPPGHDPSRPYPAIFVTHGSDADDRFVHSDLQWNYPVQLFVQRGYIVILINDPVPFQNADIAGAYRQWGSGAGKIPPDQMAQLIWINGTYSFEDAARQMAEEGIIDINRVGIAGYSRGSQMVNVTMTHSRLFKVATSGDGGYLEPAGYWESKASYDAVFGGSPLGAHFPNYQALSPSLRASFVCGPILMQMASSHASAIDFYHSLRASGVPSQISLYPGENHSSEETHIFHIPSNRFEAMQENLAWFDFWLLGRAVDNAPHPEQVLNWKAMRRDWQNACLPSRR